MRKKRALEHSLLRGQDWGGEGSREGDWGSTQPCRRKPRKRERQLNQCFVTSVRLEMATEFRNMEIFGDPDESTFSGWVRGRLSGGGSTKKCKAKAWTSWVRPTLAGYSHPSEFPSPWVCPSYYQPAHFGIFIRSHPQWYLTPHYVYVFFLSNLEALSGENQYLLLQPQHPHPPPQNFAQSCAYSIRKYMMN